MKTCVDVVAAAFRPGIRTILVAALRSPGLHCVIAGLTLLRHAQAVSRPSMFVVSAAVSATASIRGVAEWTSAASHVPE
eukprot:204768-Alexandrium_andersonii.AAC.1